ncbi:SRPBCC family protein [Paenibacillus oryzisoli]|uniref:SRPBCC family protein n=1 Tax=Paenibacillus oryzisoli TaxID=1850517 RepID=UPI003D2D833B
MNQQANDKLIKEIFIECRPETLFSFFIDAEKMKRWMGQHVLLEPKLGGKFRIDLNGNDVALGEYMEIVPNEKVVLSWGWEKSKLVPPGSSKVEFRLQAQDQGTLLMLTHYDLPIEEIEPHVKGWTHFMKRLLASAGNPDSQ